jgi:hypothetical protein
MCNVCIHPFFHQVSLSKARVAQCLMVRDVDRDEIVCDDKTTKDVVTGTVRFQISHNRFARNTETPTNAAHSDIGAIVPIVPNLI